MMISYNSYTQSLSISNHTKSNNASIVYAKIVNKEKLYAFVVKNTVCSHDSRYCKLEIQ